MPSSNAKRRTKSSGSSAAANKSQPRSKRLRSGTKKSSTGGSRARKSTAARSKSNKATSSKSSTRRAGAAGKSRAAARPAAKNKPAAKRSASTAKKGSGGQAREKTQAKGSSRTSALSRGKASSAVTTDHVEIRRWVEEHGGIPATVKGTEKGKKDAGILRIDFPGYSGEQSLEKIEWYDFFQKFEDANLAFLYDPDPKSRFNKFVNRETIRGESKPGNKGRSRKK